MALLGCLDCGARINPSDPYIHDCSGFPPPQDWDQETYCTEPGCRNPATHRRLTGMIGHGLVSYLMVCCTHARGET